MICIIILQMVAGLLNWSQCTFASSLTFSDDKKVRNSLIISIMIFLILLLTLSITAMNYDEIACHSYQRIWCRQRNFNANPPICFNCRFAFKWTKVCHTAQHYEGKHIRSIYAAMIVLYYTYVIPYTSTIILYNTMIVY